MKKAIPIIAAICSTAFLLVSCSTGKNTVTTFNSETATGKETNFSCFVTLNDGTVQQYASLKLVTGIFKTPHLLADGKVIIHAKDITAYHDGRYYAVSDKVLTTTKTSYVAITALPGFAQRIASGKMNVYFRKFYNGNNSVEEYFLQQGNDGAIVAYSSNAMKEMLKDNAKALEYYNSNAKVSPKSKKILAAAELYNNGDFFSKN